MLRFTLALAFVMAAGCSQELHPTVERIFDTRVRSVVQGGSRIVAASVRFESRDGVAGRVRVTGSETSQTLEITYAHQVLYKHRIDAGAAPAGLSPELRAVVEDTLSRFAGYGKADREAGISQSCYDDCNHDFGVCVAVCAATVETVLGYVACISGCSYVLNQCLNRCPCTPSCYDCNGSDDTCGGFCYPGTNPACPPSVSPGPSNGWGGGCPAGYFNEDDCDASDDCYGFESSGYPGCYF